LLISMHLFAMGCDIISLVCYRRRSSSRSVRGVAIVRGVLVVLNGVVYVVTDCLIVDRLCGGILGGNLVLFSFSFSLVSCRLLLSFCLLLSGAVASFFLGFDGVVLLALLTALRAPLTRLFGRTASSPGSRHQRHTRQ